MIRRAHGHAVVLLAGASLLVVPQLGTASSGGAAPSDPGPSSGASPAPGKIQHTPRVISVSGNGITVTTSPVAMLRKRLRFSGRTSSAAAGRTIEIDRSAKQRHPRWIATASGRIRRNGSFNVTWNTNHTGRFSIRVRVLHGRGAGAASAASPALVVTVYKVSIATLYGPGFYGSITACGLKLTKHTLGTANRTLKCGTPVSIDYHGRTIVVPVIDRGPYANGADWDLTMATGKLLGMDGTARIGAAPVSSK